MAKILPLTIHPNPLLRKQSLEVDPQAITTPEMRRFITEMIETMQANNGVGLAAVQVGELIRLTIVNTQDGPLALFNPVIRRQSWAKETGEEGCLSIPGVFGKVKRAKKITVSALDYRGEPLDFTAEGYFARVIQHEVDHLNGILFIDRTKNISRSDDANDA